MILDGIGLHSGKKTCVHLKPLPANQGIRFKLPGEPSIKLSPKKVVETILCTSVDLGGTYLKTIEHLLSVLNVLFIDNILIDLKDGLEIPILDGSSKLIFDKVKKVGIIKQPFFKKAFRVTKKITVNKGDAQVSLSPVEEKVSSTFSFMIDFSKRGLTRQYYSFDLNENNYYQQIASSRTFGFAADKPALARKGLALGANTSNCLVLDHNGNALNENGVFYADECVKHKILDAIGDLYVIGNRIIGHYEANKASHALNNELLLAAIEQGALQKILFPSVSSRSSLKMMSTNPATT